MCVYIYICKKKKQYMSRKQSLKYSLRKRDKEKTTIQYLESTTCQAMIKTTLVDCTKNVQHYF